MTSQCELNLMPSLKRWGAPLLALALCYAWSSPALALDPATSTDVTALSFSNLPFRFTLDEATAYIGLTECQQLVSSNSDVTIDLTTSYDLRSVNIDATTLFQASYTFGVDRGSSAGVTCTESTCTLLSDDATVLSATSAKITTSFRGLTGLTTAAECDAGIDREFFIRLTFNRANQSTTTLARVDARLLVDTIRPEPPLAFDVLATEDALRASWEDSPSADRAAYGIFYSTQSFDGGVLPQESAVTLSRAVVNIPANGNTSNQTTASLTPGQQLYVSLATRDAAGNFSTLLDPIQIEVLDTIDFWEAYRASGGSERGGYCAQAPVERRAPVGLGMMAALGAAWMWRRRRRQSN